MMSVKPKGFGGTIRKLREKTELPLRIVAANLDIDQAILSKIERGKRKATRAQVLKIAGFYQADVNDLLVAWLSDKIFYELMDESNAVKALHMAEEKIAYRKKEGVDRTSRIIGFGRVMKEFPAVKRAWLFGSFARQDDTRESDIDVLIDVPKEEVFTLFDIAEIQDKLQKITNRKIDVVILRALRPQIKDRIQPDLKLFYET